MKFSKEDMISITKDDTPIGFEIIEEGDWTQNNRFQLKDWIFEYKGKFYRLTESRSGSPFMDWYYDSDDWPKEVEVPEVKPVEVITTQWRLVNAS